MLERHMRSYDVEELDYGFGLSDITFSGPYGERTVRVTMFHCNHCERKFLSQEIQDVIDAIQGIAPSFFTIT